jgi:hypothetical protein
MIDRIPQKKWKDDKMLSKDRDENRCHILLLNRFHEVSFVPPNSSMQLRIIIDFDFRMTVEGRVASPLEIHLALHAFGR